MLRIVTVSNNSNFNSVVQRLNIINLSPIQQKLQQSELLK